MHNKKAPDWVLFVVGAGAGFEPTTSGLSLRAALWFPKPIDANIAIGFDHCGVLSMPSSATGSGIFRTPTSNARRTHNFKATI